MSLSTGLLIAVGIYLWTGLLIGFGIGFKTVSWWKTMLLWLPAIFSERISHLTYRKWKL
jgi:hypothetical protein